MRCRTIAAAFLVVLLATTASMAGGYAGEFTITAYCSCTRCCGAGAKGITASGKRVRGGMIAADWAVLSRGSRVRLSLLPGRTFVVEDTGSAIKGNRIDVWLPSHSAAVEFGIRRSIKVWIVPATSASPTRPARAELASLK